MATHNGKPRSKPKRTFDARPDTLDFRDQMYVATLVEVPPYIDLEDYQKVGVPVLNQGREGACTGFGLATVANFLLRTRKVDRDSETVSPRMLYQMARRYDEWPGEQYDGSSARGAMKGWHKHGVCSEKAWPYDVAGQGVFSAQRIKDASSRPLGAYFRVNHKDLVGMHAALAEVRVLYATAFVHEGWQRVDKHGRIPPGGQRLGGHAFAIVAFDQSGFWIQNSWGETWGKDGFAHVSYDDWLANGTDVWVARLGVPVRLQSPAAVASNYSGQATRGSYSFEDLRPHIISIGNNGLLRPDGTYATSAARVRGIFADDFPRITQGWKKKRILLYAHGGLTGEDSAIQRVADYRSALLDAEVYPLAFIWNTDYWTTLKNILEDAMSRRRPEGFLDAAKDFMLDRLDDALEPLARQLTGKREWDEMKQNALAATTAAKGGARLAAEELAKLKGVEIHLVGHSAGAIFHARLAQLLATAGAIADGPLSGTTGHGLKIASCTLWAPACTVELFGETYLPLIKDAAIRRFALFTLTDKAEQDDNCARVYNKSLLYLVSNAFEDRPRIPVFRDGVPILGMEKFMTPSLRRLLARSDNGHRWVLAPNAARLGSPDASQAVAHGDFDDDRHTLAATLAIIKPARKPTDGFQFARTRAGRQTVRDSLERQMTHVAGRD